MNVVTSVFKKTLDIKKTDPVKYGYIVGFVYAIIISLLVICFNLMPVSLYEYDIYKNSISPIATIATLLVLIYDAINNFYLKTSLNKINSEVIGIHKIYYDFKEHISEFRKKIYDNSFGKTYELTLVTSSMAYGIRSEESENVKIFFDAVKKYLDDVSVLCRDGHHLTSFKIYMWEEEPHKKLFGAGADGSKLNSEEKAMIKKDLGEIIDKINALKENVRFNFDVYATKRLDWRMFMYRKEREEYGMTAIFTPLTIYKWRPGDWALAAYSSTAHGINHHCDSIVSTLIKDGSIRMTDKFLNKDVFFLEWFELN